MDFTKLMDALPWNTKAGHGPKVLEIDLARGVLVAAPENPLEAIKAINSSTLGTLRDGLHHAADDDKVAGLVLRIGGTPHLDLTTMQELGLAIAEFGEKKPTVAVVETFGELGNALPLYAMASHAKTIWLQPTGLLSIAGVHLGITLVRGLLEKGGLEPQFGQRKEYKSAADRFAAHEVTEPHREMMQRLADSIVDNAVATVAARRGRTVEEVRALVDRGMLTPDEALAEGLIDRIGYRDEAYADVLEQWGSTVEALQCVHRYESTTSPTRRAKQAMDRKAPTIGLVPLRGAIVTGRGRPGGPGAQPQVGSDVVCQHLRAAGRDDRVQAVILQIDSPGGSAVASDSIWREVKNLRSQGCTVIAQMGSLAASGGYYSAMAADEIVALPGTLTGSIGVLAGKFVAKGTYDKLGLVHEAIETGRHSGMLSADRPFTDEEWGLLNSWLDTIYDDFVAKAAEGRSMEVAELEPLARGRVWTGADAQERRLVDHLGGLELAVQRACDLADLDRGKVQVKHLGQPGLLERFQPANSSESKSGADALWVNPDAIVPATPEALLQRALGLLGVGPVAGPLMMPWRFDIR